MRKYIMPNIKVVELDPDQAMLQACSVSGAYFSLGEGLCVTSAGTTSAVNPSASICGASVRSVINTTTIATDKGDLNLMPS